MSVLARPTAAVDPRLLRAYRRLVLVYPRGRRRDELLDTLVECAAPGRRRPAPREIANLLFHGSRARLGRPASRGVVVLAVFVALAAGFLGAAAANWLGWQAVGPLPAGAEAEKIRETVFPGLRVWGGGDAAKFVTRADGEGIAYGYAMSWVEHTPATRDVPAYTAGVLSRLEAAGWTVTSIDPPLDQTDVVDANPGDREEGFTAVRGGLGLRFFDSFWPGRPPYDSDGSAGFLIWHQPPWWLTVVSGAGALLAAALAWLLTGWVSRRLEPNGAVTGLVVAGAICFVLGLMPAALLGLPFGQAVDETAAPFWYGLVSFLTTMPATLSGIAAVAVVGAAVCYRPETWLRALGRRPSMLVAAGVVVVVLIGLGVYRIGMRELVAGSCTPSVPTGVVDPPSARLSYLSRVFISPQTTDDQRNLVQAAIGRAHGGAGSFSWDPASPDFTEAFCAAGSVPDEAVGALPYYWTVDLDSPGLFAGIAAEVVGMPGVVAVQHVPAS
jgi:hypothetical protein